MDPQACLNEMVQAIVDGEIETAQERLFALATWIQRGGAYPALAPPILDIIQRRRAMLRHTKSVVKALATADYDMTPIATSIVTTRKAGV